MDKEVQTPGDVFGKDKVEVTHYKDGKWGYTIKCYSDLPIDNALIDKVFEYEKQIRDKLRGQ